MNSNLYNKRVKISDDIKDHLRSASSQVNNANQYTEGYRRNKELQGQSSMTYQQLKRIKNFFDSYKGNTNDPEYILNGGTTMKGWVDGALRFLRDSVYQTKKNKSETGMENQHIKNHEKNNLNIRPSQKHEKTINKHDTSINEDIIKINKLIKK